MLRRLSDRILYMPPDARTDRPILAAILGDKHTLMLDAGNSRQHTSSFLNQLLTQTGRQPDLVAITHWHWDHTFGMAALQAPTIGHRNLRQHLARYQSQAWTDEALDARVASGEEIAFCAEHIRIEYPDLSQIEVVLPTMAIAERTDIDLGGVTCELIPLVTDHSNDSLALHVREERTLFLGDAMGADYYATPMGYTPERAARLCQAIREIGPFVFVESHSGPVDSSGFWEENGIIEWTAMRLLERRWTGPELLLAFERERQRPATSDEHEVIDQFVHDLQ